MIVVVAIMATIASCGTPTRNESADYELETSMVTYHKWHGMFITYDTIDINNSYNIVTHQQVIMRWTKPSNINELHADGGISCDTIWYKLTTMYSVTPMYSCDR